MLLSILALGALALVSAGNALARPEITEFHLADRDLFPGSIVTGPDGNLWFANTKGQIGQPPYIGRETTIARMTTGGQLTEFTPPSPGVTAIARGPSNSLWYMGESHVGRITMEGQFTELPAGVPTFSPLQVASGPEGDLWYPARAYNRIVRVAPDGKVESFAPPQPESGPEELGLEAITLGPDGNFWFTEYFKDRIGRITPSGEITEFPVGSRPLGITSGPDGNLWFAGGAKVGRITPTGRVSEFAAPKDGALGPIVTGPDGRLWFRTEAPAIGRLTPSGRASEIKLPSAERNLSRLTSGPEGAVWYSSAGDPPCEGGGGTCLAFIPRHSGVIGRVKPGPLSVAIKKVNPAAGRHRVSIGLTCEGGKASSSCAGTVRLRSRRGARFLVGRARFHLLADARKQVQVRLSRRGGALLARRNRLGVIAKVSLSKGEDTSRPLTLHRPG